MVMKDCDAGLHLAVLIASAKVIWASKATALLIQ